MEDFYAKIKGSLSESDNELDSLFRRFKYRTAWWGEISLYLNPDWGHG